MSSLQLFNYGTHEVRTILIDGEPWFVVADVCKVLELSNPTMAAQTLDPDDLSTTEVMDSMARKQTARTTNEAGVYQLVFQSRKPSARDFRRWVTKEVLPSIRKTGSYSNPLTLAERTAQIMGELDAMVQSQKLQLEAQAPLVAQATTFREADGLRTIGDLSNDLKVHAASNYPGVKVHQQDVFDLAGELGLIIRGNTVRRNQPTAKAIEAGWVKPKDVSYETENHGRQSKVYTRLTPRGYGRVWDAAVDRLRSGESIFTRAAAAA